MITRGAKAALARFGGLVRFQVQTKDSTSSFLADSTFWKRVHHYRAIQFRSFCSTDLGDEEGEEDDASLYEYNEKYNSGDEMYGMAGSEISNDKMRFVERVRRLGVSLELWLFLCSGCILCNVERCIIKS